MRKTRKATARREERVRGSLNRQVMRTEIGGELGRSGTAAAALDIDSFGKRRRRWRRRFCRAKIRRERRKTMLVRAIREYCGHGERKMKRIHSPASELVGMEHAAEVSHDMLAGVVLTPYSEKMISGWLQMKTDAEI